MSLAYRSYFAFISNPLINSKGQNVSPLHGFINSLFNIREEFKPDYIAIVFDRPEPTFRHKIFSDYKATRNKMPDDMSEMMPILKDLILKMNLPLLELPGFEADDIIGTITKKIPTKDLEIFLVTVDKDYMQLVNNKIKILKGSRDGYEILGIESVKEKFGVEPEKVIEVLGLMGDSSDNVPGVKGIGEKTAIPLIQKFGSIENIYKNIDKIEQQGVKNKLIENEKMAFLSRDLVTIHIDVPLNFSIEDFVIKKIPPFPITEILEKLELKTISKKIVKYLDTAEIIEIKKEEKIESKEIPTLKTEIKNIKTTKHNYKLISTEKELKKLAEDLSKLKEFVFDTETTSVNAINTNLVGISFCNNIGEAFYVPVTQTKIVTEDLFGENKITSTFGFETKVILKYLKKIFENPKIQKIGQNIKFDSLVLSTIGINIEGISFDTLVASFLIRNDGEHSLDALALKYLNYEMVSFAELIGDKKKTILDIPVENISDYSCEDADITYHLFKIFSKTLKSGDQQKLAYSCEFPLISTLLKVELNGIKINQKFLNKMEGNVSKLISKLEENIYKIAEEKFNINSTQQLGKILFDKLKLPIVRKTKTGYSTDIGVLEELQGKHKIIPSLLEYRTLNKILSTYIKALPELINSKTGKIHTSFSQTIASTGRLSSSNPNLQNIPIRTEIGREIRRAFIPSENENKILSADYSQIELRVFAHISKDKEMVEAFKNGEDIHTTTAQKVFGVDKDSVTKDMRRRAKEVNFGLIYGIGVFGLARNLEITQSESKEIITKYFQRFPGVKKYMDETLEFARKNGFVETLFHRRRYFTEINSSNRNIRQNQERQAINMPIQGTAADMIKIAMIAIQNEIENNKLKSKMILQVHDELVFDVPKNEIEVLKEIITEKMQNAIKMSLPIIVDIGVGDNWLEAHS